METLVKEKEILNNETITVLFDYEHQMAKFIWHGNPNEKEYMAPFNALLDFINEENQQMVRFYSDVRNQGVVNPQNRKWFEKVMLPAAIERGLKRGAVVFGGNVFKRYYLNMIIAATNKFNMPIKLVANEQEGIDFLTKE